MISIVIPTLNAAATLPATITALQAGRDSGLVGEILVIDGGSTDRTMAVAEAVGAKVLHSAPGRGGQLQRGAVAAKGEWFLDNQGRLGFNPTEGSAQPTEDDLRDFQQELQQKLSSGAM